MKIGSLKIISGLILAACMIVLSIYLIPLIGDTVDKNTDMTQNTMKQAIDRALVQCYAIEGSYPSSLDYLSENYGIYIQDERFYYYYEYIGSNIRPIVQVLEK
jgi:hypothetical protein